MSEELKRTIDTNLAGLRVTDGQIQNVMSRIQNEENATKTTTTSPSLWRLCLCAAAVLVLVLGVTLFKTDLLHPSTQTPLTDLTRDGHWLTADQVRIILNQAAQWDLVLSDDTADTFLHDAEENGGCTLDSLLSAYANDGHSLSLGSLETQVQFSLLLQNTGYNGTLPSMTRTPSAEELSVAEALSIATDYIRLYDDPQADFSNADYYTIGVRFLSGAWDGLCDGPYYAFQLSSTNAFGTDYDIAVEAQSGYVLRMRRQRGAGDGHTGDEVTIGFQRIFGLDMHTWSQQQLRVYIRALGDADSSSLTNAQQLFLRAGPESYPDFSDDIISRDDALHIACKHLDANDSDALYAQYSSVQAVPLWKAAIRQQGASAGQTITYVEMDALTGDVTRVISGGSLYGLAQEFFPDSLIQQLIAVDESGSVTPVLSDDDAIFGATRTLYTRYGVNLGIGYQSRIVRDLESTNSSFTVYTGAAVVIYRPNDATDDQDAYWVALDWYGDALDSGYNHNPLDAARFALLMQGILPEEYDTGIFSRFQETLRTTYGSEESLHRMEEDGTLALYELLLAQNPATQNTIQRQHSYEEAHAAAREALNFHAYFDLSSSTVFLTEDDEILWHMCLVTDRGRYAIDLWDDDLSVAGICTLGDDAFPWALRFLPVRAWSTLPTSLQGASSYYATSGDPGIVSGMRADHIVQRYITLYGTDMLSWSPAELRSFQQSMSLSENASDEMSIPCLQKTVYPDIPEEAISRSTAATYAIAAFGMDDLTLRGGVLIDPGHGQYIWKLSLNGTGGRSFTAEVDCMTGEVLCARERASNVTSIMVDYHQVPENTEYWFSELILDEVIEEVCQNWQSTGNG